MMVVDQVLALFILLIAGLACFKARLLPEETVGGLNKLVVTLALPCLSFMKLQQEATPQLMGELFQVFGYACAGMLLSCLAGFFIFHRQAPARRAVLINLTMFSNAGFMGYPVVAAAFGEDALIYAVIYVAAFNLMSWTLGVMVFERGQRPSLKKLGLNPALLSVVLGLAFFLAGWRVPQALGSAMNFMGATTTPLSMLVIGARLSALAKAHLKDKMLLAASALRLVVYPCLLLGGLAVLGAPETVRSIVFLCAAMPSAAVTVMQAEQYQCDSPLASRGVALSTALSMATIPLMLTLL